VARTDWKFVGVGVLRCWKCDALVDGETDLNEIATRRLAEEYYCPDGHVKAPARAVDRELQAFALQQWTDPAFIERWRRARLKVLDAEIAQGLARYTDRRVTRRFGRRTIDTDLINLAQHLTGLVAERAGLAAVLPMNRQPGATMSLDDLRRARSRFLSAYRLAHDPRRRPLLLAAQGGERLVAAHLTELEERLWRLLANTVWKGPFLVRVPERDKAFDQDWATSPARNRARRQELLRLAVGEDRLVVRTKAPYIKRVMA
jgi:hypothetical protein